MSSAALSISNLTHQYKSTDKPLIDGLNLEIEEGSSFGLFGPNGAGKTTLMSLITSVIPYTSGSIQLFGKELKLHKKEVLSEIGYVPQSLSLYEELSPIQNLRYFGAMMGLSSEKVEKRSAEILDFLGLQNVTTKPIRTFSGGMKRRVNLAIGVLHQPRILFLDEPTVGVDVQTRHAIIAYLKMLNDAGTTLFYTSHHLSEAQELCNEIALIDQGHIIVNGNLNQVLNANNESELENLFIKLTGKEYRD